ncbi:MAG: transcription termination factor NusA [Thermodesulfovibrionales bacterium]|nr:transcription termination factor NusA [Thermodesulfovibrionales bacterium]
MTKELLYLIDQMCREKGISRGVLFSALESALLSAARKKYSGRMNINLRIDQKTCAIDIFETKKVVEKVENPNEEISLKDAKKLYPGKALGDEVELPLNIQDFGRIAAQTAKQVIFQRVREAERDVIYNEFKDKVGQVVSGTVVRKERGYYYIHTGKTEAVMPHKDALPGESLRRGDTVRSLIEDIKLTPKGPIIHVTRTNPEFVKALFKMEVPEVSEGLVVIKDVVREPGERTKLAVYSKDPSIDPVGACVGMKGTRVQAIVRELRGERIDIIPWTDDPRVLIARALSPATIDKVGINEEAKSAMVVVGDQHLAIAIGKKGQNVRLAMKLTGWDIDILSESEYSNMKMEEADKAFGEATKEKKEEKPPSEDG